MSLNTPFWFQQFRKADGSPLVGGKLYTYYTETTTPKSIFYDFDRTIQCPNPLPLDDSGFLPQYYMGTGLYTFILKDRDGNTVAQRDNIFGSGDGSDFDRGYFSAGISVTPMPEFTDIGLGQATFPDTYCRLFSTPDFTGKIEEYSISAQTFLFTDNAEQYVCIKYDDGFPHWSLENNKSSINGSDIVLVYTVWRQGNTIHSVGFDSLGLGLSNKISDSVLATQLYRKSIDGGLMLTETNPNQVHVTSADVYAGVVKIPVTSFNTATDILTEIRYTSNVISYVNVSAYNNSQYVRFGNMTNLGGSYGVRWFYRSIGDAAQVFYHCGFTKYPNVEKARLATAPTANLPKLIRNHCVLIGRIIIKDGDGTGIVENVADTTFAISLVQNHNDLENIQGGTLDERYHLDLATYDRVTSGEYINAYHDYTQSQGAKIILKDTTEYVSAAPDVNIVRKSAGDNWFGNTLGADSVTFSYTSADPTLPIEAGVIPGRFQWSKFGYDGAVVEGIVLKNDKDAAILSTNVNGDIYGSGSMYTSFGIPRLVSGSPGSPNEWVFSDVEYLPLSGGTLTGPVTGTTFTTNVVYAQNLSAAATSWIGPLLVQYGTSSNNPRHTFYLDNLDRLSLGINSSKEVYFKSQDNFLNYDFPISWGTSALTLPVTFSRDVKINGLSGTGTRPLGVTSAGILTSMDSWTAAGYDLLQVVATTAQSSIFADGLWKGSATIPANYTKEGDIITLKCIYTPDPGNTGNHDALLYIDGNFIMSATFTDNLVRGIEVDCVVNTLGASLLCSRRFISSTIPETGTLAWDPTTTHTFDVRITPTNTSQIFVRQIAYLKIN